MDNSNFKKRYSQLSKEFLIEYGKENSNVVLSPISIIALLCMAADSTGSETRDEIIKLVCEEGNFEEFRQHVQKLCTLLSDDDSLSLANALCLNETIKDTIKPDFKEKFINGYGADLFASKNIVDDVNAWVREKTKGMIEQIADKKMEKMLACLMNVICFDAKWENEYEQSDIEKGEFQNVDGSQSRVINLISSENEYIENGMFTGFARPYKGNEYSFMALLPKDENSKLFNLIGDLDLGAIYESRKEHDVTVMIPEFTFDFSEDLTAFLQSQGMEKIFTPGADFSPMTDEWIKADGIIHKAHIELNRKGTKTAAVTSMFDVLGSYSDVAFVFLNRPFIYAIMHNKTGLPVFAGMVNRL